MKTAAGWLAVAAAAISATAAPADQATPLPDAKHRPEAIVFADIPWLTPADSVAVALAAHGYAETRWARTKDRLAASGKLFDRFATVQARLDDQGRLSRLEIMIPSKGEPDEYQVQRKIYDDAVTEMQSKYGRRRQATEWYRFPYERGDGRQARGIREGYVTFRSVWSSRGGDRLTVEIDSSMSVLLAYESRWWRKVEDERRRKKAKDL